jgi:hypothetical protein
MKLTTAGLKARDHQVEIGGLNVLVGPNGSGKSSIADAIRFLALGYVPSLGKRPVDTAVLMSDREIMVSLDLPGARSVSRTMVRTDKGYQVGAGCSWLRSAKASESSKEITALFGAEEQDVAECLDIRQLLAATPNQRAARIEQLLSAGKRTPEETAAAVARLTIQRLIDVPDDRMPADYKQALPMVAEGHAEVLREVAGMLLAKITEAGITGALSWANEEKRGAANGLQAKTKAEQELRLRAAEVPEPDEREIKRLEGERDKLQRALGALVQQKQEYDRRLVRRRQIESTIGSLQEMASRSGQALAAAEATEGKTLADLQDRSAALLQDLESIEAPADPDRTRITELMEEYDALEAKLAEIPAEAPIPDPSDLGTRVRDLERQIEQAKANPWAEVLEITEDLRGLKLRTPAADKLGIAIRRLDRIARENLGGSIEDMEADFARAKKELGLALKARAKAIEAAEKIEGRRESIEARRDAISREVHELEISLDRERTQGMDAYNARRRKLAAERQAVEGDLQRQQQTLQYLREKAAGDQRRLASLQDELRGVGELGEAPQDHAALDQQLGYVREALDRLSRARAVHEEIRAVLASIEAAKSRRDVYAAIEWALQRQREIEISSAGGPLLQVMTRFFQAAGRREQPFIRAGAGSCAIGWRHPDGEEIQVQALSGGEWCLFAAALTSAVILCRQSQLKVLLVEAGETDDLHLAQLLAGVRAVSQEGQVLDALVMVPRWPTIEAARGWNTIEMVEGMPIAAEKVA